VEHDQQQARDACPGISGQIGKSWNYTTADFEVRGHTNGPTKFKRPRRDEGRHSKSTLLSHEQTGETGTVCPGYMNSCMMGGEINEQTEWWCND